MDFNSLMDFADGFDANSVLIKDVVVRLQIERKSSSTKSISIQVMTTDNESFCLATGFLKEEGIPIYEGSIDEGNVSHMLVPVNVTLALINGPANR